MTPEAQDQSRIQVAPARTEHWQAIEELFARTPCWCQYWRMTSSEYSRPTKDQLHDQVIAHRKQALQRQLEATTPPGILAFIDSYLVGWCGIGEHQQMGRLVRSRTIPSIDERPVWSVVCFLVRPGYRRRGVAQALLDGAIECARTHSVPALEAYPVDPWGKRLDTASAYVGTIAMFERAGFQRIIETSARSAGLRRWLVRLEL